MTIRRRPETADDQVFVERLLLERTAQDLSLNHLPTEVQAQLLGSQVRLRLDAVRKRRDAVSEIILVDEQASGWVVHSSVDAEVLLIEIAVEAAARGRGVGTVILNELIEEAGRAAKPVKLHVDAVNVSAIRLYERLGFQRIGGNDVQYEMERPLRPNASS